MPLGINSRLRFRRPQRGTRTVSGLTGDSAVLNGVYFPTEGNTWTAESGNVLFREELAWHISDNVSRLIESVDTDKELPELVEEWDLRLETGTLSVTRP